LQHEDERAHPPGHRLDAVAAGDPDPAVTGHLQSCPACAGRVSVLEQEATAFRASHDARQFVARLRRPRRRRAVWTVAPLVLAAAVLLLVQRRSPDRLRWKGGLQVAVIRDRRGDQERLTGPFSVRAGDRVRIEIGSDRRQPLTAGLLADDGAWVALLAPAVVPAGVSLSELAARFDASPTRATLLVGAPEKIDSARRTRNFGDLATAWRVTSER
jgi:predicted anti-sigma-YlaC factor YlaD